MFNLNIGGTKKWTTVADNIRANWKVMDITGKPDFKYDLNSMVYMKIADSIVDNIYTSHTLEHVCPQVLPFLLTEIYRILKPCGVIRVVVPDVQRVLRRYIAGDKKWLERCYPYGKPMRMPYPKTSLGHVMTVFYSLAKGNDRSGHNVVFDWETLCYYFKQAGFQHICKKRFNVYSPQFAGLDFKRYKDVSLYMEASK